MTEQTISRLTRVDGPGKLFVHESGLIRLGILAMTAALVSGLLWPGTGSAREISFVEARSAMIAANEQLLADRSDEERMAHLQAAARSLHWPQLSLSAKWTRINDPIDLDLNPIRDVILELNPDVPEQMIPSFVTRVQDESFFKSQVSLTWPIFTGGRIMAANRLADANLEEARHKTRHTRQVLTSQLVSYYFGVRLTKRVVEVRQQVFEALERHAYEARRMEEEGLIAQTERLHAEVALANAKREYQAAQRDEDIARVALASVLALDSEKVGASSTLFLLAQVEPLESFVTASQQNHPILSQIEAKKDQAHQGVKVEQSHFYPDVYLFAMHELNQDDLTILEPTWAAGVGLNLTLFHGLERLHKTRAARALEHKINLLERKAKRDLAALVEKRYQELMKAAEQFQSLESTINVATENLRARKRAFEEGLATSLDVVDAQLSLSSAQVQRLQAAYAYDVALAALLEASGHSERFEEYRLRADVEVES